MDKKVRRDCLGVFTKYGYQQKMVEFGVFSRLCDKARELVYIYSHKEGEPYGFVEVAGLEEELITMSPIEQILSIAFKIYEFYKSRSGNGDFFLTVEPQKEISCKDKTYKVDFYVGGFYNYLTNQEFPLKSPIIIECDGSEQMNYDYAREDDLKASGYDVMRFTGSQIYNAPLECVNQVYKYVFGGKILNGRK